RRGARDDRQRHLRPDTRHGEQMLEELPLADVREAVELEGVLPHMQVRLQDYLGRAVRKAKRGRRGQDEIANSAHVEDEALGPARNRPPSQHRDHPTARRKGGASAWQIATASASAAWCGTGGCSSPRILLTIRCTCSLSARP